MPTLTARVCRHCGTGKVNRPRGLCRTCYYTNGVREMYPRAKFGNHVHDTRGRDRGLAEPTDAMPGSPAKLAVLEQRATAGQRLWHPLDARLSLK